MSRLKIAIENEAVQTVERLYKDLERRIVASPPGICPVDLALNFLRALPCADLRQMRALPHRPGYSWRRMLEEVLERTRHNGKRSVQIERYGARTSRFRRTAPSARKRRGWCCAVWTGCRDEYVAHIQTGNCYLAHINQPVPCVALLPCRCGYSRLSSRSSE